MAACYNIKIPNNRYESNDIIPEIKKIITGDKYLSMIEKGLDKLQSNTRGEDYIRNVEARFHSEFDNIRRITLDREVDLRLEIEINKKVLILK